MLKVICGEDVSTAYEYFVKLQEEFKKKGFAIIKYSGSEFLSKVQEQYHSPTLFSTKKAFFVDSLIKKNRKNKKLKEILQRFAKDENESLVVFEQMEARELKSLVPAGSLIKFDFPSNLWKLIDSLSPKRKDVFYKIFKEVSSRYPEQLIFFLIHRRIRELILAKEDSLAGPYWLQKKLKSQAAEWTEEKLYQFIENLHKIDVNVKTSSTPFSIIEMLDILINFAL